MLVVLVTFRLHDDAHDAFMPLMHQQAHTSLVHEPGCTRFDVCTDPEDPARVILYEIYVDHAAFEIHLASDHFAEFDSATANLVAEKSVDLLCLGGS